MVAKPLAPFGNKQPLHLSYYLAIDCTQPAPNDLINFCNIQYVLAMFLTVNEREKDLLIWLIWSDTKQIYKMLLQFFISNLKIELTDLKRQGHLNNLM